MRLAGTKYLSEVDYGVSVSGEHRCISRERLVFEIMLIVSTIFFGFLSLFLFLALLTILSWEVLK